MMSTSGAKASLYKHFRKQEKKLYEISDRIGCMSQANVDYVLAHNPEVKIRHDENLKKSGYGIVEVCPNSIEEELKEKDKDRVLGIYRSHKPDIHLYEGMTDLVAELKSRGI